MMHFIMLSQLKPQIPVLARRTARVEVAHFLDRAAAQHHRHRVDEVAAQERAQRVAGDDLRAARLELAEGARTFEGQHFFRRLAVELVEALGQMLEDRRRLDIEGLAVADLGAGAGFPGLVLAELLRDRTPFRIVLYEATAKKCRFLEEAAQRLQQRLDALNALNGAAS